MRAPLLLLAAVLALAPVQAQVPPELVASLHQGGNVLTDAQAEMAQGVWNQTGGSRIDGSVADEALRRAAKAAAADGGDVDFAAVLEGATTPFIPAANNFRVFIPHISRETGAFLAYYLISMGGTPPTAARMLGFASPAADGGVLLTATKDEDTGLLQLLVRNDTTAVSVLMEGLEVWDAGRTKVLDNQIAAAFTYEKLPTEAVQEALADVLAVDPANASHSMEIAEQEREEHGMAGQGKGARRLRRV